MEQNADVAKARLVRWARQEGMCEVERGIYDAAERAVEMEMSGEMSVWRSRLMRRLLPESASDSRA